ncbi:hypothetical protein AAVH_31321 [Aphelenchoides avenae]|nr:hypothetical protein AAVH_31321 [Aphelenchus avenae]
MFLHRFYRLPYWLALLACIGARTAATVSDPGASATPTASDPLRTVPITSPDVYCPAVNGISWTLFREKCYHRYSASFDIHGASPADLEKHYKTWFEAREECAKFGAKLASVHDQATLKMLLELMAGDDVVTDLSEATWIGLQFGAPDNVTYTGLNRTVLRVENVTGCYWPAGERPRLVLDDTCPANAVEKCSITYNDTFHGQWEDGKLYDEDESADFWAPDEPNDDWVRRCVGKIYEESQQSKAYCERGVDGKPDKGQHCAQIFPADEKQIKIGGQFAGKWADYWCWMKMRGYICERPAKRSDGSEDITSTGVDTPTSATTRSCGVETTTQSDSCSNRGRAKTIEIEREIKATITGKRYVIDTIELGDTAAGTTWLGGGGGASSAFLTRAVCGYNSKP